MKSKQPCVALRYYKMKVRIKSGDCPSYLTVGKVYDCYENNDRGCKIIDDRGDNITGIFLGCAHLNGGSWEIVEE